ncbi:MAG: hypothetical protein IJT96_10865 [Lachnospiraceae bacterium]|nr:hypothetical protein [Lachnospiraceae bacterium]
MGNEERKLNETEMSQVSGGAGMTGKVVDIQIVDKSGIVVGSYTSEEEAVEEFAKYGVGYQIKKIIR